MTIDKAQAWWDKTKVDLRLRRGESGRQLLALAGEVGYSPYRLRRALERIKPVLERWVHEDQAPPWAERLFRQCKQFGSVLEVVPPVGSEIEV
jgi:hypothetical protein